MCCTVLQAAAAAWFGLKPDPESNGQVETEFTRTLSRRLHRRMGSHMGLPDADTELLPRGGADAS